HLDRIERRRIQCREDASRRRKDDLATVALVLQERAQLLHHRLVEHLAQARLPARLEPDAVVRRAHEDAAAAAMRPRRRRPTRNWKISLVMSRRSSIGFCTRSLAPARSKALWLAGLSSPVITRIGRRPLP